MTLKSITIRTVQALKPGETVWDAGHNEAVKGFGVRRQRGDAAYVIKYRTFGRQRFVTIGRHGSPWTPDLARREAKRLLGLVAAGKDPQTDKAEAKAKAADTLGKVAKSYLEYAKKKQKPRSYAETERHLLINWKPLHPDSIFHIQRRHIAARLAEINPNAGQCRLLGRGRPYQRYSIGRCVRGSISPETPYLAQTGRPSPNPGNKSLQTTNLRRYGLPVVMTIMDALSDCSY